MYLGRLALAGAGLAALGATLAGCSSGPESVAAGTHNAHLMGVQVQKDFATWGACYVRSGSLWGINDQYRRDAALRGFPGPCTDLNGHRAANLNQYSQDEEDWFAKVITDSGKLSDQVDAANRTNFDAVDESYLTAPGYPDPGSLSDKLWVDYSDTLNALQQTTQSTAALDHKLNG
jgi:hypothetical protein